MRLVKDRINLRQT